jgi:ATP-binding cassette, subfamily B, bacterial PglK
MTIALKILSVLSPLERRNVTLLLVLMFIGMLFEILSVGIILPVIAIIMQEDLIQQFPVLQTTFHYLGEPNHTQLVVGSMLALVIAYTMKSFFIIFLIWKQMSFIHNVQASLSQRLFINYLRQPYTFHLQRNSAQLIRNIVTETGMFALTGLSAAMILLTEILALLGIVILLLFIEPVGAIITAITIGLVSLLFYYFTRGYILKWGKERQYHEGMRIQHLQQGLGGVKDVKLLGREDNFFSQYSFHNKRSAHVGKYVYTMQQFPRILLELLAVIGLSILVVTMVMQGDNSGTLFATLAVFAAAAFRMLPSVNKIITAIQRVRYSLPVINILHEELVGFDECQTKNNNKTLLFKDSLNLESVTYKYPLTEDKALSGVNISIPVGTSVGFIGGSGAGKSTIVDIILGLLTPVKGRVLVDGIDIEEDLRCWQNNIGYVPQSIYLTDDSLRRNIAFGISNEDIDELALNRAIKAAQLNEFVNSLENGLDSVVGERGIRISGGQRQRIGIARALYHDPEVLVLDEATSSLDVATETKIMEAVNTFKGKKTIIIVAHRLSTVENCNLIYHIKKGKIVKEGLPDSILASEITEAD